MKALKDVFFDYLTKHGVSPTMIEYLKGRNHVLTPTDAYHLLKKGIKPSVMYHTGKNGAHPKVYLFKLPTNETYIFPVLPFDVEVEANYWLVLGAIDAVVKDGEDVTTAIERIREDFE